MLTVGSAVRLAGENEVGEIESIAPDGKSAVVVFGIVKMKLRMSELHHAPLRTPSSVHAPVQLREKFATLAHGLDLRGMTGEEAIPLVDKFIDDAALVGLHRIDIIHGKGTGALRKKVAEFLSHHPRVKTYRLAEWNEGGTGATVVELADN
jgi:DNA mismatch repair protein MutS2